MSQLHTVLSASLSSTRPRVENHHCRPQGIQSPANPKTRQTRTLSYTSKVQAHPSHDIMNTSHRRQRSKPSHNERHKQNKKHIFKIPPSSLRPYTHIYMRPDPPYTSQHQKEPTICQKTANHLPTRRQKKNPPRKPSKSTINIPQIISTSE
jgi:hypothetical protein